MYIPAKKAETLQEARAENRHAYDYMVKNSDFQGTTNCFLVLF